MKNKGISIFTLVFLGILLVGIGVGIGYLIPKNTDNTPKNNTIINNNTNTNTTNIQNTTNTITNNVYNNTITNTTGNSTENTTISGDAKVVLELFKKFAKAVNDKDYATVESISDSNIVSILKKYNVTNMLVGDDTVKESPNRKGEYIGFCSYNIDYNGLSVKDIGLGFIMGAKKVNDQFKVDTFTATGP